MSDALVTSVDESDRFILRPTLRKTSAETCHARTKPNMERNRSLGWKLGSHRVSIIETLSDEPDGLTVAELARMGRVPKATAHRIVTEFVEKSILTPVGRHGRALLYAINGFDRDLAEAARALREYTLAVSELDALEARLAAREKISKIDFAASFTEREFDRPEVPNPIRLTLVS